MACQMVLLDYSYPTLGNLAIAKLKIELGKACCPFCVCATYTVQKCFWRAKKCFLAPQKLLPNRLSFLENWKVEDVG